MRPLPPPVAAPPSVRRRRRPPPPWRADPVAFEQQPQHQERQALRAPRTLPTLTARLLLLSLVLLSRAAVQHAFQPPPLRRASAPCTGGARRWSGALKSATTGLIPPSPADDGPPGAPRGRRQSGSRSGKPPSPPPQAARIVKEEQAAAAAAEEAAQRLAAVRAQVGKGGGAGSNLVRAMQELRALRREGRVPVTALVGVYREVLAQCRHARGANAFATRLLPVAKEAARLWLLDAGADVGAQREAKGVVRAVARAGDADGAVALLELLCAVQEAAGAGAGVLDEHLFFAAIKACGASPNLPYHLGAVERLLERMKALGVAKSAFVYSAAFKAYGAGGPAFLPQVQALAEEMLALSPPPLAAEPMRQQQQQQQGGPKQQQQQQPQQSSVDLVALNSLLDAYARCGDAGAARALLGKLLAGGGDEGPLPQLPRPDAFSYNIVLRALGAQGDVEGALALYAQMMQPGSSSSTSGSRTRIAPDAITVNTLVAACARAGSLERALGVLRSSPVPASVEGYSALVHAFATRGDTRRAQEVLGAMEAAGVRPNARTYASLMRGAAAASGGDVARPRELLRMMALQGEMDPSVRPTAWAVNGALGALVKQGQLAAALELREEMAALGIKPDATTCNALLDGFLHRVDPPRVSEAEALFMEMLEVGPSPDAYTFATLLSAYQPEAAAPPRQTRPPLGNPVDLLRERLPGLLGQRGGNEEDRGDTSSSSPASLGDGSRGPGDMAVPSPSRGILPGPDRVLEMVRLRNARADAAPLLLDTTAVNTLLVAYTREGAVRQALAAFADFKRGNLTLPATLAAAWDEEEASVALERCLRPGRPDVVTYTVLIKAVAQTGNMYAGQKIMALYREMRAQFGVAPDLQLAHTLVNSFVRARSRVGGMEMEDLEEVFVDLKQLGWRADTVEKLERRAASFLVGLYSEAWKEKGSGGLRPRRGAGGQQRPQTTAERLFEKYNWNKIDSGFAGF